ncbi:MAG: GtrA family protein [Cyclobacteriaceae bacterium]
MEGHTTSKRPNTVTSFFRYNLVAILATGIDFIVLIVLTEIAGLWYLASTVLAAIAGAITAFVLGRYWVFVSTESKYYHQAFRYFLVASGSVVLNSLGVYFFTDIVEFQYIISKTISAILVGVGYNYTLSRFFVFK